MKTFDKHEIETTRQISILNYLENRGCQFFHQGNKAYCLSPFSSEQTPSFCVYKNKNIFVDYSSGHKGDIIKLVSLLEGKNFLETMNFLSENIVNYYIIKRKEKEVTATEDKPFDINKYKTEDKELINQIKSYASSRSIYNGYEFGKFYFNSRNIPAILFPLEDENGVITGVKLRSCVKEDNIPKFYKKGKGVYVLENFIKSHYKDPVMYLTESETSSNSLWERLKETKTNAVIVSFGSVNSYNTKIPKRYEWITNRKVIIDYDGNEKLYKSRAEKLSYLGNPVKLILPKGEDLNSLYHSKKIKLIDKLI